MRLEDVPKNYDKAAPYYDRLTGLVFERLLGLAAYRTRTIDLLGDIAGSTVLDVGCGTGRNFPLLAERVGASGRIVGIDYSQGMLARARRHIERAGWANVVLLRGDAARLENVPEPVDAVTSAWCYGIVHDLEAAIRRAVEVLRPGGRLAVMDFGRARPDHGLLRLLFPVYRRILQWTGIDSSEDLDDARLRRKWARGRRVLKDRLEDYRESRYLCGTGLILSGRKPQRQPNAR